ncbi:MAG: hypothetical protein E7374_00040 [Clostridiales bacterium]|nr:hypothetical protein [Clostridiales bacterium]
MKLILKKAISYIKADLPVQTQMISKALYRKSSPRTGLFALVSINEGERVTGYKFKEIKRLLPGEEYLRVVMPNGQEGYINEYGRFHISPNDWKCYPMINGFAIVKSKQTERYGILTDFGDYHWQPMLTKDEAIEEWEKLAKIERSRDYLMEEEIISN